MTNTVPTWWRRDNICNKLITLTVHNFTLRIKIIRELTNLYPATYSKLTSNKLQIVGFKHLPSKCFISTRKSFQAGIAY